ncbi:MAG: phosphogluconate dehydratase, partial [Gammaproteobacteria bacterium]|nr:phosphogluconate dehydratase [Gammaproteobacteria bacterium]
LTVTGDSLSSYRQEPCLRKGRVEWQNAPASSLDAEIIATVDEPFTSQGGLKLLKGNLGRAMIKTSAVKPEHQIIEASARVFDDQLDVLEAFNASQLSEDMVVVVRGQGPHANGMPELHKLTPALGVLQDKGFKVALVTDGRMSGASGKVPAAIQLHPEACRGGAIGKIHDGDPIRLDATQGILEILVDDAELAARPIAIPDTDRYTNGTGRELFSMFRANASSAETGALSFMQTTANAGE